MRRSLYRFAAYLQLGLVAFTGCAPTQPFFLGERADLTHYLETATDIEYPDLERPSLDEVTQSMEPFSLHNHNYTEIWDLNLEDCVQVALSNSKVIKTIQGTQQQNSNQASAVLSGNFGQVSTVYDPSIISSNTNGQPLAIDQNGNRIFSRGNIRATQVGGVEDALSEFDAQMSSSFGYNTTDRPRNVGPGNVFNPQLFRAVDSTFQAALSKRTAEGTIVTGRSVTSYSSNNILAPGLGRQVPTDYTTALELQVQHPLMRGRGAYVNRIPVMLARINEDIALHEFEGRVRNLIRDVENAYWDLYSAYRAVEAARIGYDSALTLWRVSSAKVQVGEGQPEAEAQARSQVHFFEGQLERALSGSNVPGNDPLGLYGRERQLRFLIGIAATDGRLIRPIDEPTTAKVAFDWEEVKQEGLLRAVELRQQKWLIKQREMELISAKNQLLPDVNVSGLYRWLGAGDVLAKSSGTGIRFPNAGSSAVEELLTGDYQEVGARLEFTPPAFGARKQLAAIRNSQLTIVRDTAILEEKELALIAQLSDAISGTESHHNQAQTFLAQWQAIEEEVRVWNDKLELSPSGPQSSTDVILDNLLRAQQRRAQAQLDYYRSLAEYNKSILYVHFLKGSLLEYDNIALQEGPWPEKAMWDALERARERAAATYYNYGATRPGVISRGAYQQHQGTVGSSAAPSTATEATKAAEEVTAEPVPAGDMPKVDASPIEKESAKESGTSAPEKAAPEKSLIAPPSDDKSTSTTKPRTSTGVTDARPIGTGAGSASTVFRPRTNGSTQR